MISRLLNSILVLVVFSVYATGHMIAGDFQPIAGWDNQLFPSYIISTSTMRTDADEDEFTVGGGPGIIGIQIEAASDDQEIELVVQCDRFMESTTLKAVLPKKGESYRLNPKIKFHYDKLAECNQATAATIAYKLNDGAEELEKSVTVTFRAIHDCPFLYSDGEELVDTSFTFAAYVNEQHPFVDKLLRESLDIGTVDSYIGYQSKNPDDVIRQVYSLWDMLVARDVRYSSITTTAATSKEVASQHVRLLEDTINNQQANCVDGSVLFASMLQKIGIRSFLVLVPGHCYVGFYLDDEKTVALGLETTMIGSEMDEPEEIPAELSDAIEESLRDSKSWPSFVNALAHATVQLQDHAGLFSEEDNAEYQIIDIESARSLGVLPIPFTGKEKFVAFDHSASRDPEAEHDDDSDDE